MTTMLYCEGCGKRCGKAWRGDTEGWNAGHDQVLVTGRFRRRTDPGWTDNRAGDLGVTMISNLAAAAEWPIEWTCSECGRTVRLGRDTARLVGDKPRLRIPVA